MVYSAYHSKACAECRLRRTKCDTLRPSCSQCIRAGRECKGYRDFSDFMFRDESERQVVKHQRRKDARSNPKELDSRAVAKSPMRIRKIPRFKNQNFTTNITPLAASGLGISPEEQATCFFFHNCVLEETKHARGSFQFLTEVFSGEKVGNGLSDSVTALGMAGMAHLWKSSTLMASAQMKYNSALRLVGTQLRDLEKAKADQTLISVMLLGLYETNTCSSRESMNTWTKHIQGAAALLNYRGKKQLKTRLGHQLFVQLRAQVITNCIQRHVEVPASINEWSQALDFETPEEAAVTQLCQLGIQYCNLRASIKSFRDFSNQAYVISTACTLDSEYADWAARCPIPCSYDTVVTKDSCEGVFNDHYQAYSSIWDAAVWNNYRAVRILINELLVVQICHIYTFNEEPQFDLDECNVDFDDFSFLGNQLLASNSMVLQLSHEICASVPYFLGYDPDNESSFSTPKTVNGNLILWSLYIAASTSMVSEEMRSWVAARLYWISRTMGIRQAVPLAYTLSINQELRDWQSGVDPDFKPVSC